MILSPFLIGVFCLVVIGLLALDLYSHRKDEKISIRNASLWASFYVIAALLFAVLVYYLEGRESAILFLSGFALEKMLSVDNLFVFIAVFTYFGIKDEYQHRILHWGIIGAIVFRIIFVAVGTGSLFLFGKVAETAFAIIILYTAYAMWTAKDEEDVDYDNVWYIRFTKKILPVTSEVDGHKFFIAGKATPLFICLVAIEISDILFAFDSVPAIIVITRDPFLIVSAMVFAIMGLRSLYFVLLALKRELAHVEKAVVVLLVLFAGNILAKSWLDIHLDPLYGLLGIVGILSFGVLASVIHKGVRNEHQEPSS